MKDRKQVLRALMTIAMLVLVISPVDMIPDVAPAIGWLDDVGYLLVAARELFVMIEGVRGKRISESRAVLADKEQQ